MATTSTVTIKTRLDDQGQQTLLTKYGAKPEDVRPDIWRKLTTFSCRKGDALTITISGADADGPARFNNSISDMNTNGQPVARRGDPAQWTVTAQAAPPDRRFLCPDLPGNSLFGRFGDGKAFVIGDRWAGTATADVLYLGVNDKMGGFFNNTKDYTATISVTEE